MTSTPSSTRSRAGSATASSSPRRWRSWRGSSASRRGWRSASWSRARPGPTRGSSPRTTCTPGPSCTSPAPAGCGSSPRPGRRRRDASRLHRAASCPAIEEPSVSPSATRSSDALPERGQSAEADAAAAADDEGSSIPWLPIVLVLAGAAARRAGAPAARPASGASGANAVSPAASRRRGRSCATSPSTSATAGPGAGRRAPPAPGSASASALPGADAERSDRPRRGRDLAPEGAAALDRLVERARADALRALVVAG